jgi:DNA-binding winged helix-turn-helix (wHTH) protein
MNMKIAVNTGNYEILNSIIRVAKEQDNIIAIAKFEKSLFDHIDNEDVEAFVISSGTDYSQKAVDFIKKYYQYIPVVIIGKSDEFNIKNADFVVPFNQEINTDVYAKSILNSIYAYIKNFETLKRLTANIGEEIEFGKCKYDPTKRILFYDGEEVQKLSPKQAGIFEILAANFGNVVKKDIILEKVWHDSNYFVGRSLDVFVTHLRKILKQGGTGMSITNVSNIGLMLDYESKKK